MVAKGQGTTAEDVAMVKPLTVQLHGVGTWNRGAELMAIAARAALLESFPGARVSVDRFFGDPEARARLGFYTTFESPRAGSKVSRWRGRIAQAVLQRLVPGTLPGLGLVLASDLDAVIDASGFAFSDQWGPGAARGLLEKMRSPDYRDKPLILLPQALGPFAHPEVARACRELFQRASLICARDRQSFAMVEQLGFGSKLRQYPDFTLSVAPLELPPGSLPVGSFVAVVPNARMLDKTDAGDNYLRLLEVACREIAARGSEVLFVQHDADEDIKVVEAIRSATGRNWPVYRHADPRVLKHVLGRADFVVGSRFHALVSALSQGVPCLGLGWSHKYDELFAEFDCAELLLDPAAGSDDMERLVAGLLCSEQRATLGRRIAQAGARLKERNREMWSEVCALLRSQARLS
jgi:polysaccharide pyruvyl transferase WcaK-like protein